jgi:hypothetical protein
MLTAEQAPSVGIMPTLNRNIAMTTATNNCST